MLDEQIILRTSLQRVPLGVQHMKIEVGIQCEKLTSMAIANYTPKPMTVAKAW